MVKANYKETLTNTMSKNGHKNIKMFVLVIASAGFQSAIGEFHHPALVVNYHT